jgi:putative transposase
MNQLRTQDPALNLTEAAQALGLSRSAWYAHERKPQRARRREEAILRDEVRSAFAASRNTYGVPRLRHALRAKGLHHGKNRLARLMREEGCVAKQKRRFVPRTTVTDRKAAPAPNRLLGQPVPQRPDKVWLTDITYLPTGEGWLYLAAEMDACSRRILGWSTLESLDTQLPLRAHEAALASRHGTDLRTLQHHSDRGCQYTSVLFRHRLALCGITQSMSRPANCYDNAVMESFWATLKTECFGPAIPATREQARALIFDYIETFYNPVRLHSALEYRSPVAFEKSLSSNQP